MEWDNPFIFFGLILVVIAAVIGSVVFLVWHFPNAQYQEYGWGRQVCVTTKGWDTFSDKITCVTINK
jgi:hypothetical protein